MPYIAKEDREKLADSIEAVAEDTALQLRSLDTSAKLSTVYRAAFKTIADTIYKLVTKQPINLVSSEQKLAGKIYELDRQYNYDAAFNGELNYSITRLIQIVPKKMVQSGVWKEELRYWVYSQTVGALVRAQDDVKALAVASNDPKNDWIFDGLVGVFEDIKDEYKRRVNTAYEAVQIRKSGDCYDTPYHTELVDAKDTKGWQEVMKDYRQPKH